MVLQEISTFMAPLEVIYQGVLSIGRVQLDLLVRSVRSGTSRSSGRQTERATCNYIFEKLTFLENSFNKDKSVSL